MPKYTRRDFEFMADNIGPLLNHPSQIDALADILRQTNSNFNRDRFICCATTAWESNHADAISESYDDYVRMVEGREIFS